jgi:hypothetical protein
VPRFILVSKSFCCSYLASQRSLSPPHLIKGQTRRNLYEASGFNCACSIQYRGLCCIVTIQYASYDGDQFDQRLLPEDRQAISSVQDAIQKWGHYVLVYRPENADIVLMVQSRPSEDLLAVYDAKLWPEQSYLWRVMGRGGLQQGETPLVSQLQTAVEKASR